MRISVLTSMTAAAVMLLGIGTVAPASAAPPPLRDPIDESIETADAAPAALSHCTTWRRRSLPEGLHAKIPSVGSGGTTNCLLSYGDTGNGVRALQIALTNCNGKPYKAKIDGIFGPLTRSAVFFVQDRENITEDGIYGPETKSNMFWPAYNIGDQLVGSCWSSNSF